MSAIIDFRIRPNTPELVSIAENRAMKQILAWAKYPAKVQSLEELIHDMDEEGIVLCVFQGRDLDSTFGWKLPNDHVAEVVAAYPNRFVGFGGVDPHKRMDAVREVVRCIKDLGMRGISIDPYFQKLPANDRLYYPIYSKCQELGVIMNITTGPGAYVPESVMTDSAPDKIDDVARDFPNLKIVVSHAGYPWVNEMIGLAMRHKNIYFEASSYEDMPGAAMYFEAANSFLADKMLYASAHPFFNFRDRIKIYAAQKLSSEARQKIMFDNAAKLLGVRLKSY